MLQALSAALTAACEEFDQASALSGGGLALSYRALREQADKVAAGLRAVELAPSEPVHVSVSNRPLDVAALFGVWLAGGVAVPIHRNTPPTVASGLQGRTRARFLIDSQASNICSSGAVSILSTTRPPPRPMLDDAAFIIFTSGSTGEPKGVVVGNDAFHGKILQIDSLLHFRPAEQTLLVLNVTFSFGLWVSLLTLFRGGTLVMQEKFDAAMFFEALADHPVTRVGMVPTMMRVLFADSRMDAKIDRVVAEGNLHQILIGGESLGRSLADTIRRRFSGTQMIDIYGLTETATCDFFAFPADYAKYPGSIGRPSPHVKFRIADLDDLEVEPHALGELQIDTPYIMKGYLDDAALTSAAFCERWFRTGDLARRLDGDVVELMGRKKEVISRGGNKVTPMEIEQSICSHPDIAAAMAVGIDDPLLGERIHVLLVARRGVIMDLPSVQKFLETRLERFKLPDRYYVSDELPLGRTGKADRAQFRSMIHAGLISPLAH